MFNLLLNWKQCINYLNNKSNYKRKCWSKCTVTEASQCQKKNIKNKIKKKLMGKYAKVNVMCTHTYVLLK